jgi:predicted metal-dependent enzyme (double-stranded beta helix superfamily)
VSATPYLARLRDMVVGFGRLADAEASDEEMLQTGAVLLGHLIDHDDWLPDAYAEPDPDRYRQYLLHRDSAERFSVVSFVWGPGQATPIHDHRTWGLVGVLRGAELVENWEQDRDGAIWRNGEPRRLERGHVDMIRPGAHEIHRVANAYADRVSISIHVYGGDIGKIRRATYAEDGTPTEFVSGYSNERGLDI